MAMTISTPQFSRPLLHIPRHLWSMRLLLPALVPMALVGVAGAMPSQRLVAVLALIALGGLAAHEPDAVRRYVVSARLMVLWPSIARDAGWSSLVRNGAAARQGILRTHEIVPVLVAVKIDAGARVLVVRPLRGQTTATFQSGAAALALRLHTQVQSVWEHASRGGQATGRVEIRTDP